jgi:hypothetical protein
VDDFVDRILRDLLEGRQHIKCEQLYPTPDQEAKAGVTAAAAAEA